MPISTEVLAEIVGELIDEIAVRRSYCGNDYDEEECGPLSCRDYWLCNEIRQRCAKMEALRVKLENEMDEEAP